ncbi:MAG: ATP-binding protein, partial [Verrucomicrobiota bacterium]|nr:ATP-binding protein [Verrucomicrobiota bacterium]
LRNGNVDHLFRPFVHGGDDTTGLGLGLSLSRRSVELFDGTLSVHDLPGVGCVFTVNLPRHSLTPVGAASAI